MPEEVLRSGVRAMFRIVLLIAACTLMSGCLLGPDLLGPDLGTSGGSIATGANAEVGAPKDVTHNIGARPETTRTISSVTVPSYRLEKGCKSASALSGSSGYENCVEEESAAKERLNGEWKSYSTTARQECAQNGPHDPDGSYVELLTCFEIKDWAAHPESIGGVTGNGAPALAKGAAPQGAQMEN